jgi:hypothetical protein
MEEVKVKKMALSLAAVFLISTIALAAPMEKAFTGEISDTQCALKVHSTKGSHEEMLKVPHHGDSAADCARMCVRDNGGKYVLIQEKTGHIFKLDAQDKIEPFAGQVVTVRGALDSASKEIHVESVEAVAR